MLTARLVIATITATSHAAMPPPIGVLPKAGVQKFDIAFRLDDGGRHIETVQLWYTVDNGQTWHRYGSIPEGSSRVTFVAPTEGLYGFYLVATNEKGASGAAPDAATTPQQWVYVDYSPPVVQLHAAYQISGVATPVVVQMRWTAFDNALPARPIELAYAETADGPWKLIESHLPNSGSFDWRVPEDVAGQVMVRITVHDRGGHVVEAVSPPFEIVQPDSPQDAIVAQEAAEEPAPVSLRAEIERAARRGEKVARLYREALRHSARSEYKLATSRLRDVLTLQPESTDALVEMGRVQYAQKNIPNAIEAYQLALRYQPGSRVALEGLARVYIAERRFAEAVAQLGNIVRVTPNDAEAWLHLGDIAIYQGDEFLARQHYQRAATCDPNDPESIEKAMLRLENLSSLVLEFRQDEIR